MFDAISKGLVIGDLTSLLVQKVFWIIVATLVLNGLIKRVLKRLQAKTRQTDHLWDSVIIDALRQPVSVLIWVIGLSFAVSSLQTGKTGSFFTVYQSGQKMAIIATFAWFLIRLIKGAEKALVSAQADGKHQVDITTIDAICKILRLSVIITTILITLQTLNIQISGLLAVGGAGSLIAGLAAKDLLANFFGSLMVYFDRPFAVGDWIRSPDKSLEGTVEKIGWRLTRIRTFDKRPLYVPNSVFTTIAIENPSRMSNRRIYETIGLRYDDILKVRTILDDVEHMLRNHDEIDTQQTLMVNLNQFAASSLDFFIYTFTKTTNWAQYHQIKQDVLLKIADIIHAHGADIAFPTSRLHVEPVALLEQRG